MEKRKEIGGVLLGVVVIIASIALVQWVNVKMASESSRWDYPMLSEFDYTLEDIEPLTLDELSAKSDIVALVEVNEVYGSQNFDNLSSVKSLRQIDVKVKRFIKGRSLSRTISVWQNTELLHMVPKLRSGDEIIMFLHRDEELGEYRVTAPDEGYFYLAKDNKIYPARVTQELKEASGMDYGEFKSRVRSAKSEQ